MVAPYPGDVVTIDQNISYYQSYFDLESSRVMQSNAIGEWDIGFGSHPGSWQLRINSGDELFVFRSSLADVESDYKLTGNELWRYDNSDGNPDSSAFGRWCDTTVYPYQSAGTVFVAGKKTPEGYAAYAKVQLITCDSDRYVMRYQNTGDPEVHTAEVIKSDSVNFVYFDLNSGTEKYLEPAYKHYDLLFTPYYDLVYDIIEVPLPYLVRGVMLNSSHVSAALETSVGFDELTADQVDTSAFTRRQDFIGWDWKDVTINFSAGTASYNVLTDRTYLVKSYEGRYYKLRFLSYTLNGLYGFPRFEYQELGF